MSDCPIGRRSATWGYVLLEGSTSPDFSTYKIVWWRAYTSSNPLFSVVYGKHEDEYGQSHGKNRSSRLRYLAVSIVNRFIPIVLDRDAGHSSGFSVSVRGDTLLHRQFLRFYGWCKQCHGVQSVVHQTQYFVGESTVRYTSHKFYCNSVLQLACKIRYFLLNKIFYL